MPVPSPRNKILPARGNFADLNTNVASLLDGEICYAIDQDQYYQKEGSVLVAVGATKAQGVLADSAVQPGDNVSDRPTSRPDPSPMSRKPPPILGNRKNKTMNTERPPRIMGKTVIRVRTFNVPSRRLE